MIDLVATSIAVALGMGGLVSVVAVRVRTAQGPASLVDIGLAVVAMIYVSSGVGALCVRLWTGGWVPDDVPLMPMILASLAGSLAALVVAVARSDRQALGLRPTTLRWMLIGLLLTAPAVAMSSGWVTLLELVGISVEDQKLAELIAEQWGQPDAMFAIVYGVVLAPLLEELLFRGFFLPPLVRAAGRWPGILLNGVLFGLAHLADPPAVVPLALLGALLAWLRLESGSLWPSIVLHGANNLAAFVLLVMTLA